jgi:hypothetical protein
MTLRYAVSVLVSLLAAPAHAQDGKAHVGSWELADASGKKRCAVTLKAESAGPGRAIAFAPDCPATFPMVRLVVAWAPGRRDQIRFLDQRGQTLVELAETEMGLYEGARPGDAVYFLQSAQTAAQGRAAEGAAGEWAVSVAGSRPGCTLVLSLAKVTGESHPARVKPGCEAAVARFEPVAWYVDQAELVLVSMRGPSWRFAAGDGGTWRRSPDAGPAMVLSRP